MSTQTNLAKNEEVIRRGAIDTRTQDRMEFEDHIQDLRTNGVPEDRIKKYCEEFEERWNPTPSLGPRQVFSIKDTVITYEVADTSRSYYVEKKIAEMLHANPDLDLKEYEAELDIRIIRIEKPPPKPPKVIKGFQG